MINTGPGSDKAKPKSWFKNGLKNSGCLFHNDLVYMGNLSLVLHAQNLSNLDAGVLIQVKLSLIMFSLDMVNYFISPLSLSACLFLPITLWSLL